MFKDEELQNMTAEEVLEDKIEKLEAENKQLREALEGLYNHTKTNYNICGLNQAAREALKGE